MAQMIHGFEVTKRIAGANPLHPDYPLLPGDLLSPNGDGTFFKEAPGLGVDGFVLSDLDRASLAPVMFSRRGLEYEVVRS